MSDQKLPDLYLAAGAKPEEIYHALILLTSTVGYPNVAAALSRVQDVVKEGSA